MVTTPDDATPTRPHRRWWLWVVLGLAGAAAAFVVVTTLALVIYHTAEDRPVPEFESLVEHPDPSLHGTVAYTTGESRCVRIVAAAGRPSRNVLCLGPLRLDPAEASKVGKEMPFPQLVWRPDGRLEITGFRMQVGRTAKDEPPVFTAKWQKVVDVRGGQVENVPAADLPSGPDLTTHPTTNPRGQRVRAESDPSTGKVKVTLTDESGTRTLLSAHGPGEYTYSLSSAFWAPNWQWIAADDGRILVITPGDPPVTRALVDAGGGDPWPAFAVTSADILKPSE